MCDQPCPDSAATAAGIPKLKSCSLHSALGSARVNAITETIHNILGFEPLWIGVVLSVIVGIVLIGGVKSIGDVAVGQSFYFPPSIWAAYYLSFLSISIVSQKLLNSFFLRPLPDSPFGGFAGSTIMRAMQEGVSRSIFSNEAGMGISSIAAAAAKTDSPVRQALITMTGALLSTVIVCTITGLVIAVTAVQGQISPSGQALNGATLAIAAFNSSIIGGGYVVSIGLILFAFTTVIAWGYYGEKCLEYLFGERSVIFYPISIPCLSFLRGLLKWRWPGTWQISLMLLW